MTSLIGGLLAQPGRVLPLRLVLDGAMMSVALVVGMVALLLGSPEFGQMGMLPAMLLVMAMFFTSFYFTFQDCYKDGPPDGNAPPPGEPT